MNITERPDTKYRVFLCLLTLQFNNDILKLPDKVNIVLFVNEKYVFLSLDKNAYSVLHTFFDKCMINFVWRQLEGYAFFGTAPAVHFLFEDNWMWLAF